MKTAIYNIPDRPLAILNISSWWWSLPLLAFLLALGFHFETCPGLLAGFWLL